MFTKSKWHKCQFKIEAEIMCNEDLDNNYYNFGPGRELKSSTAFFFK